MKTALLNLLTVSVWKHIFYLAHIESEWVKTNKEVLFKPGKLDSRAKKENELDEILAENYYSIHDRVPYQCKYSIAIGCVNL